MMTFPGSTLSLGNTVRDQGIPCVLRLPMADLADHSKAHDAASFLAWHRYFLHIYENALRDNCHYSGYLT